MKREYLIMTTQTKRPLAVICAAFHVGKANARAFLFNFFFILIIPLYFKLEGPPSGPVRNCSHVYLCISKVFKATVFPP